MSTIAQPSPSMPKRVPPLQNGDRLTRAEFERRFDAMPELKKAELIEGVVYMPPPVSHDGHSAPHFNLVGWLAMFSFATPGTGLSPQRRARVRGVARVRRHHRLVRAARNRYEPASPGDDGVFRSEVLPGLWLDAAALMRGDKPAVLRAAQRGLATPEHAAFIAELQRRAAGAR